MSKLSQLKQDAYQAGKKRDWDQAVSIYEKILDLEKNNPTVINEMGDLCLKVGESGRAISHFLKAAAKYRKTGLLNNAVAIYKKILRHDEENLNAHWYLAETRASQGLIKEGEDHGVHFLTNSEGVSGELKEIFLNRCRELFELFPDSQIILEQLMKVFRTWNMALETSRTQCLLACVQYDAGNQDEARQAVADLVERTPEILNYPEYTKWNTRDNPVAETETSFSDFGSVSFDDQAPAESATHEVPAANAPAEIQVPDIDVPVVPSFSEDPSLDDLPVEIETNQDLEQAADVPAAEPDDDGCFSLDTDEGSSFDDLIAQATDGIESGSEPQEQTTASGQDSAGNAMDNLLEGVDHSRSGDVDLLAEILAEDSGDRGAADGDQLDTITKEIGAQVGGDDPANDADRLYEMGLVYLEMGLFDQACESLEKATVDPDFAIRAYEMWGVAHTRANRPDDAVTVLTAGLELADNGTHEYLGFLYHIGRAHEQAERADKALEFYEKIQERDRSFLDVGKRVASLLVT